MAARLGVALLVSLVVVLAAARTTSAFGTTFGAPAKPLNRDKTQPEPYPGRECQKDSDCPRGSNTTCRQDLDGHKRCLCSDRRPPQNGVCHPLWKGLHSVCSHDDECMPRSECVAPIYTLDLRYCLCKPGYIESADRYECNDFTEQSTTEESTGITNPEMEKTKTDQITPTETKKRNLEEEFYKICVSVLNKEDIDDEQTFVGKNVAAKLRQVNFQQRVLAESLIQQVLTRALLNELKRNTALEEHNVSHNPSMSYESASVQP